MKRVKREPLAEYRELLVQLQGAGATERVALLNRIKEVIGEAKAQGDINASTDDGYTMLHFAVGRKDPELVIELLRQGADPNVQNKAGTTPLMMAVIDKSLELIKILVTNGAYVNHGKYVSANNTTCSTSYLWSVENNLQDIQHVFNQTPAVQNGAFIFKNIDEPFSVLEPKLIKDACNYVDPDHGVSVFELSVLNIKSDIIKHILNNKLLIIDPKKEILNHAFLQAVDLLINYVDKKLEINDRKNLLEIIEILLQNGANVDALDRYGETSLLRAVSSDDYDLTKLLLGFKPDLNFANAWGNTPLCLAAMNNCEKACKLLIQHKADTTIQNKVGENCVTLATQSGNHAVVKTIVGAQEMPALGYTPLMLDLLDEKYDEILDNLLRNKKYTGKNTLGVNALTKGGFTALMIAAQQYTDTKPDEGDKRAKIWKIIDNLIRYKRADYSKQTKCGYSFLVNLAFANYIEDFIMPLWSLIDSTDNRFFQNCIVQAPEMLQVILRLAEDKKQILPRFLSRINQADAFGMTPLACVKFDTTRMDDKLRYARIKFLLELVEKYNAKCEASGKTVLTPLHMKILWDPNGTAWDTNKIDKTQLNVQDQHGRTPLHYACMQNSFLVKKLIDLGARCDIKDHVGRTPLHYAAIDGKNYLQIANHVQRKDLEHDEDKFGVSPFMYALSCSPGRFVANSEKDIGFAVFDQLMNDAMNSFVGNAAATKESVNERKRIAEIKAVILRNPENIAGYFKKLAYYAAVANSARISDVKLCIRDAQKIVDAKHEGITGAGKFGDGLAFGIEAEIPELSDTVFAPLNFMLPIYNVSREQDYTVHPSILSPYKYSVDSEFELITKPITSMCEFSKTLEMFDVLCVAGAKVNKTAGLHVHFNVRGSQEYNLPRYISESEELTFLKFLLLNYISIEPLLRGFMRDGKMFDPGETYSKPVSTLILMKEIEACKSVSDLQKVCSHSTTLDLTALDKHGTIEFRIHEGAVDPTLIRAWVDCTARLVKLSKEQTLQHKPGGVLAPKTDIEQLVYIFVAMRMYEKTWDSETRSVTTAITTPPFAYSKKFKKPTQVLIQESLLYNLFNMLLGVEQVAFVDKPQHKKSIDAYLLEPQAIEQLTDKQATAQLQADLRKMIAFACDNPGIIQANYNKEELDKEIDRIFKVISKIQTLDAERSAATVGSPILSLQSITSNSTIESEASKSPGSLNSPGSQSGASSSPTPLHNKPKTN